MLSRRIARDIAMGVAGGIVATWATDRAGRLLWKATPIEERQREPETRDGSSAKAAARKVVEHAPCTTSKDNIEVAKTAIHYGLGLTWGTLYPLLRRATRMTPIGAGIATGVALSVVVDETLSPLLEITPPNSAYPASAHARGFLTHAIWGLATAATVETLERFLRRHDNGVRTGSHARH